jgi:uncharacterized membrane protein
LASRGGTPYGSADRTPVEEGKRMLAANLFMIVFRLLHIVAGVLWVGSAFLFVGFIGPAAAEVGPAAGPILHAAVKKRKVPKVITGLGITTVVAGWILWLRDLNDYGSLGDWLGSNFGLVLTIGAVLATIAAFLGAFGVGRNVERLVDMSDTVAASGGPPTPEQQARIEHLGGEIEKHGKIDLVLLLLAVACMATARYW